MTTERNREDTAAGDPWLARLRQAAPIAEKRNPPEWRIAEIRRQTAAAERPRAAVRRGGLLWTGAALVFALFVFALAYAYDMPGGIADWRYSRAAGLQGTAHIPLERTPEEAARKVRDISTMEVVHRENVNGGALLFVNWSTKPGQVTFGVEYVRKSWLGWKWVTGGQYGFSGAGVDSRKADYMSLPTAKGLPAPAILFGQLLSPDIANVTVTIGGPDGGDYAAKIVPYGREGRRIWFAVLPRTAAAPYGISATDASGSAVAGVSFDDPTKSGILPLAKGQTLSRQP
ncbi:hypothetical protein SAMN02799624_00619 [Paenibacillus sp. UNC496MF]|uniref:hypothetical protein n=1 Tax=Paenibacillus sp. UNC496MF TaxID=1502753 RepID=UPI0008E497C4|nr:hypothetical protein [Paenibacillus sp. UNC496MF]SFI36575.1 hypothetical protein SAMN02799624_00619 [Paenibacillus sp. UNC496MF]